jgi:hypothetical protein
MGSFHLGSGNPGADPFCCLVGMAPDRAKGSGTFAHDYLRVSDFANSFSCNFLDSPTSDERFLTMKGSPWWIHLARIGHAVGVGIGTYAGTAAGLAMLVPGYGPLIAGGIGVLATTSVVVTHYADKGIASVSAPPG